MCTFRKSPLESEIDDLVVAAANPWLGMKFMLCSNSLVYAVSQEHVRCNQRKLFTKAARSDQPPAFYE